MNAILLVAYNTLRQTIRQRLYFNILVFGVGMLLLSMVLGGITYGYADRVVRSFGLSGVSIALDLMALLVGVSLIHEEIDKKTLFVVLTRPLARWQYVVGRYLGLLLALSVALTGFALIFSLTLGLSLGELTKPDVVALAAVFPEAAILGALGLVLSAFSTPTLSSGLGLGFWLAAATTDDLLALTATAEAPMKQIGEAAYYLLPSFARFNFRDLAVYQGEVIMADVLSTMAYGAVYAGVLVALASLILTRREMV